MIIHTKYAEYLFQNMCVGLFFGCGYLIFMYFVASLNVKIPKQLFIFSPVPA